MKKFWKDESGQGMVEYGLIIALVAVAVIAALAVLGPKIAGIFTNVNGKIDDAVGGNAGGGNAGGGETT